MINFVQNTRARYRIYFVAAEAFGSGKRCCIVWTATLFSLFSLAYEIRAFNFFPAISSEHPAYTRFSVKVTRVASDIAGFFKTQNQICQTDNVASRRNQVAISFQLPFFYNLPVACIVLYNPFCNLTPYFSSPILLYYSILVSCANL